MSVRSFQLKHLLKKIDLDSDRKSLGIYGLNKHKKPALLSWFFVFY